MRKTWTALAAVLAAAAVIGGGNMAEAKEGAAERTAAGAALVRQLYGREDPAYVKNEPELSAVMQRHIYGDVRRRIVSLSPAQQELLVIAVLTAAGTPEDIPLYVRGALRAGASPAAVRETVFQCTPYAGLPKVKAAMAQMHKAFKAAGVQAPLPDNGTVSEEDRYEKGLAVQTGTFGQRILDGYRTAPRDAVHINYFLSQNCFGDFYTRTELDMKMREMITFAVIATLGGCESQLRGHAAGNLAVGGSRQELLDIVTLLQPYNGYPRTLNALAVVNETAPAK